MKILHIGLGPQTLEALIEWGMRVERADALDLDELPDWIRADEYEALVVAVDECSFGGLLPEFLRKKKFLIPLIVVTRMPDSMDWREVRAAFLGKGCDDALRAPVHADELIASLRVIERRKHGQASNTLVFRTAESMLTVDFAIKKVSLNGHTLKLSKYELKTILHLAANADRVVSRADLTEFIYLDHTGEERESNTVDVFISRIRKAMGRICDGAETLIETRRGIGYILTSQETPVIQAA